ncbi:hypothetical protein ACSBR1_013859 [Camellia fascicularis]
MGPLSVTAKKRLAFIPAVIAGVYIGRSAAKLYNLQIEQHAMEGREAIKRFAQEIQNWEMESKSNSANTVCRDAAGSKDGI